MNPTTHFLSKECFACKMGSYWIILNASRDRYFCVADEELASIGGRIDGWQEQSLTLYPPSSSEADANALIDSLSANGIITGDPMLGKSFTESECLAADGQLQALETSASTKIPFLLLARFFATCGTVDWRLRTQSFSRILARIVRRRRRVELSNIVYSAAFASGIIGAFKVLRPLYPRSYLCLFDSLALIEFLAGCQLFPHVVFGVVADPFQAHCWVQEGSTILNDDVERVRRYKPIMIV
jgi:Transglutaminase-like superfamily